MMTNDQPHSVMRQGWRRRRPRRPKANNCDTVRLAIRLRVRRISCTFGLSRLAEKAGSCREVRLESKSGEARSCGSSPASTLAAERGVVFAKASDELGLEGIVSKRQGSSYRSGGGSHTG